MRAISTVILVAVAASQLGATDCGQAISDPGFDLWCGGSLCDWKVERGATQEVPTWHQGDHGVSLIGDDVAIEQVSPVASTDGTCIEFDLIANVAPDASAVLNVDVAGNGSIDASEHLPTGTWQPLSFQIRMPNTYYGVRFEIAKVGPGSVELANIGAKVIMDGCYGQTPLYPTDLPLGAPCDDSEGCANGYCDTAPVPSPSGAPKMCVSCGPTHLCEPDQICGALDPISPLDGAQISCTAPAIRQLGQLCVADADCATGKCHDEMCSTCNSGADCAAGESCAPAWDDAGGLALTAFECAPGLGQTTSGQPCVTDADCSSGACDGAMLSVCADGRSCATNADCPFSGLLQTACTPVGVQGGSCL